MRLCHCSERVILNYYCGNIVSCIRSVMDTKEINDLLNPAYHKRKVVFNDSDDDDSFVRIKCYLCSKTFFDLKAYKRHLLLHLVECRKRQMEIVGTSYFHPRFTDKLPCDVREKTCSDYKSYATHKRGSIHAKNANQTVKEYLTGKPEVLAESGEARESEDDSLLQKPFAHCAICNKVFYGIVPYQKHVIGSAHKKKIDAKNVNQLVKEYLTDKPEVVAESRDGVESEDYKFLPKPFARCSICNEAFYGSTSYRMHMNGSAHKMKILQKRPRNSLKYELQDNPQIEDEELFTNCGVCNKQFSGTELLKIHLDSVEPENQVKRVQTIEKLKDLSIEDSAKDKIVCKDCKRMFTYPFAFDCHLNNNKHEKQKVEDKGLEFVVTNTEIAAGKSIENISSEDDCEKKHGYKKRLLLLSMQSEPCQLFRSWKY